MPLHPQFDTFLKQIAAAGAKSFHEMSVSDCRQAYRAFQASLPPSAQTLSAVEDRQITGPAGPIRLRVYRPPGATPHPLLVYLHGGGWVVGDLDTHDKVCRELCGGVGAIIVSVESRLAPEHKFPAAVDDGLAATAWAFRHASELRGDPARIAIGGDSAGATLATVIARRRRDAGAAPLAAQLLVYPAAHLDGTVTPSMIDNAIGYRLQRADMEWFRNHYLRTDADGRHPDVSPLRAENLSCLPPALVMTCEFDPLRDEGETYGRALQAAGVPVTVSRHDGAIHGTLNFCTAMEPGRQMMDEAVRWLRERLAV